MQAPLFILLNIVDAYLTKISLEIGAIEANPFMTHVGGVVIVKAAISLAMVFILYYYNKEKVLWLLNFLLLGVILWNSAVYWLLNYNQFSFFSGL
jgi:hypothetical protein